MDCKNYFIMNKSIENKSSKLRNKFMQAKETDKKCADINPDLYMYSLYLVLDHCMKYFWC